MKIVKLDTRVEALLIALRELPREHTPEIVCPHEAAKGLCLDHINRLIAAVPVESLIHMRAYRHMLIILDFICALYHDGRACPWSDMYYTLKNFYEPREAKKYSWFNQGHQIRKLVNLGLVELDEKDYALLSNRLDL